jgi:hypothetical protein
MATIQYLVALHLLVVVTAQALVRVALEAVVAVAEHQMALLVAVLLGKEIMVGEASLTGQVLHLVAVVVVQIPQDQMVATQALAALVATELHRPFLAVQ